jgi:hypothetical protein
MDHISFSSGRLGFSSLDPADTFYRFQHFLRELHGWRESLTQARAGEIFWRTLIANIVYEQREASSEVGEWFLAYMGLMEWHAAVRSGETCIPILIGRYIKEREAKLCGYAAMDLSLLLISSKMEACQILYYGLLIIETLV